MMPTKTTTISLTSNDNVSSVFATITKKNSQKSSRNKLIILRQSRSEAVSVAEHIHSTNILDSPSATTVPEVPTSSPPFPFPTAFSQTIILC